MHSGAITHSPDSLTPNYQSAGATRAATAGWITTLGGGLTSLSALFLRLWLSILYTTGPIFTLR